MRLASRKPQSYICISSRQPDTVSNLSLIKSLKLLESVNFYICKLPPLLIPIPQLDSDEQIVVDCSVSAD